MLGAGARTLSGVTPWWAYVSRHMVARGWTAADLARASRIDQSVIGRWRDHGARPTPENVRKAAAGLNRNIREAIVAAGHYTPDELSEGGRLAILADEVDLTGVSHERLASEVLARMLAGTAVHKPRPVLVREGGCTGQPDGELLIPPQHAHDVATVQDEPLQDPPKDPFSLRSEHADG